MACNESSGRPISIFSYRPIPITTNISNFHIGWYRYRYNNCIIGRYRYIEKCYKMQKKISIFLIFQVFTFLITDNKFSYIKIEINGPIWGYILSFISFDYEYFIHGNPHCVPIVYKLIRSIKSADTDILPIRLLFISADPINRQITD